MIALSASHEDALSMHKWKEIMVYFQRYKDINVKGPLVKFLKYWHVVDEFGVAPIRADIELRLSEDLIHTSLICMGTLQYTTINQNFIIQLDYDPYVCPGHLSSQQHFDNKQIIHNFLRDFRVQFGEFFTFIEVVPMLH